MAELVERDEVQEKASNASMTWVYEEQSAENDYDLCHAHVFSVEIQFCGCHLPGLDTIYVQAFNGETFKGEDLMVGDEVVGFEGEPLHPGTDAVQLKQMLSESIASAAPGSDPPMIHLRRHIGGINSKSADTAHNPNLIFHYAKEYPDGVDGNKRPFVFAADKPLLKKADSHLTGMVTYHEIDNAQLQEKLNMLVPETGDVARGAARSKATEAIRLNQEHAFMSRYIVLMRSRKHYHTEVLNINKSALHGLPYEKKKSDLLDKLAECEAQIVSLIDIRMTQFSAYSDYDFREELVDLKAYKTKLVEEHAALVADLEEKDLIRKKEETVAKIKALENLEKFSVKDKYDMMERIHKKELELDGIFDDEQYQQNEDERFPTPGEFWAKVNNKSKGMSLQD
uniref:Uncharacterized protein n=1 Tax=Florenciella parvula TaxID=236787 RepID=A0A7S2CUK5_9STRA|mmetsp:Transcript_5692/g.11579  ORF Transcript_5692/g.11579 Transcript_5692/m.11579 type:complete len:397 (+) Transcript_5692:166-1356(+)|eukprot:CAMPEP_0182540822 /NCGR_PEP_ID=MMETSP1323-20130603/27700_1 /TAXON_ID=236787 /ORGANISM="Florenciella parvula, Strain RCC1693" /LENGTH=396 /DNA_ID=CAMNT_0024751519 /DNA_START=42 /DNA_END=1232 /DNA_ORIENTATION=+